MFLEENEKVLKNVGGLDYKYALLFKKFFKENHISNCLELGFANGKSSCYIASILKDRGDGHLTTIDLHPAKNLTPNIYDLSKELDLDEYITPYFERHSYTWRLMKLIEVNPEPIFDFCFIDGSHNWYHDGFAFFLVDKLLKPGALLVFEALNWTYNSSPSLKNTDFVKMMDDDEKKIPHIKQIYELLVKTHPDYERFDTVDDRLAWAFKKQDNFVMTMKNQRSIFHSDDEYIHTYYYNKLNNSIKDLSSKLSIYEEKFDEFEKNTLESLNSENILFNTLFLDYNLEPNKLLRNIQTLCSELLLFIDNVCKKHNLKWWLDYGNLLGAVRHENFVPWDDDIDIGMMREDYHKLIDVINDEILRVNLSEIIDVDYRYRNFYGNDINSFIQLFVINKEMGKNNVLAGVDIFPYDYLQKYNQKTFGNFYEQSKWNFYNYLTNGNDKSKLYMGLDYDLVIEKYYEELHLSYNQSKYIIPGVEGSCGYNGSNLYELMVLDTDKVFPLTNRKFGNYEFPCPNNSDYYLESIYGDYMKIPKSIRSHGRVNLFRKEENINDLFELFINKFKEVNSNFF